MPKCLLLYNIFKSLKKRVVVSSLYLYNQKSAVQHDVLCTNDIRIFQRVTIDSHKLINKISHVVIFFGINVIKAIKCIKPVYFPVKLVIYLWLVNCYY